MTITITKWQETFENADTRKRQRLKSFHCPSGIESRGMVNLLCHFPQQDALAAFGVFQMICQLSATLPADARGRLIHTDKTPMTADYLARLMRLEICHLSAALEILTDKRIGWIIMVPGKSNLPPSCHPSPGFVQGEGEGEVEIEVIAPTPKSAPCTIQQAIAAGRETMIPAEGVEVWFAKRDRDGWMIHRNNGTMTPIDNWRKDLAASKSWAVQNAPNKTNGKPKSYQPRIDENLTLTPYATTAH